MTVEDIYRVIENDCKIIIVEESLHGEILKHAGKLRSDNKYMSSYVKKIQGWEHGLIIEI